jgi:hypothetical protein
VNLTRPAVVNEAFAELIDRVEARAADRRRTG